jgi:hypothetical protein
MNIKYADVMKGDEVARYLDNLPVGLYDWETESQTTAAQ